MENGNFFVFLRESKKSRRDAFCDTIFFVYMLRLFTGKFVKETVSRQSLFDLHKANMKFMDYY